MDTLNLGLLFVAAVLAGAINSVAGGGTLISFPSLLAVGVPPILANATNTAALVPGSASSALAYREELRAQGRLLMTLFIPSVIGGVLGAIALVVTPPEIFNYIVPFLVLFATLLFAARDLFNRLAQNDAQEEKPVSWLGNLWGVAFQMLVAAYGGYFGAGIGILMLASLSIMGLRNIHRMNGVKTVLAAAINGVALIVFVIQQKVVWPLAVLMAAGAVLGGYSGARLARRVNQNVVRTVVIVVGLIVSAYLFARLLF
ncbi:MAG: sulfite exporter TauE/SafE family protein [Anaerolineae bacterium]|nr:sulfite exporter TauE/SafE family protein [Thermoflexales bacterium]MDW8408986.1 sulfite exporter TauE/SafE family protein [Anaerolineae bacterium]